MKFLHDGRPPVVREAHYNPPSQTPLTIVDTTSRDFTSELKRILASLNVASKEWVIRQYDHEVQGGSVIKPLVGVKNDGPGDASVIRPVLASRRGLVISCGMNPRYGVFDTYHMAASAIDEAVRNCVAVGADPDRIAILDNFCWGYTDRPETLGSLVRAALACYDVAVVLRTPFISGKDSLNNEFSYVDERGERQTISIPPSLLISAMGQVDDVGRCVTMDLKAAGNRLYAVGTTRDEMGGSHFALVSGLSGGRVPTVDAARARATFLAVHAAIRQGTVRACHDLSEGGLAVAAAEMAFAGELGAVIRLVDVPADGAAADPSSAAATVMRLFSESNTRFLCEVPAERAADFEEALAGVPHAWIGEVSESPRLTIRAAGAPDLGPPVIDAALADLKAAWQAPLRW
jgi:phosphoribosylformylglycinamidine synthase